jgi:hypothetical protein
MLREDNSGFVNFPSVGKEINKSNGKTIVYLVAFDTQDISNQPYVLSNLRILLPGEFVSDDITFRQRVKSMRLSIDELVQNQKIENSYDKFYFPELNELSIPLTSAIAMGWSDYTYEKRDNQSFWVASFKDLTYEGRKLYYSIKKLHNNKEVRILTFNNV